MEFEDLKPRMDEAGAKLSDVKEFL